MKEDNSLLIIGLAGKGVIYTLLFWALIKYLNS